MKGAEFQKQAEKEVLGAEHVTEGWSACDIGQPLMDLAGVNEIEARKCNKRCDGDCDCEPRPFPGHQAQEHKRIVFYGAGQEGDTVAQCPGNRGSKKQGKCTDH